MQETRRLIIARDAYLNLVRLHEELAGQFVALFKAHGLSQAQYNVLRIVAGTGSAGASCQHISDHLLTRVPDVTRLIDRMETGGLVTRERSTEDRRVVLVHISAKGRKLLEALDEPVADLHERQFAHMSQKAVKALGDGLSQALER